MLLQARRLCARCESLQAHGALTVDVTCESLEKRPQASAQPAGCGVLIANARGRSPKWTRLLASMILLIRRMVPTARLQSMLTWGVAPAAERERQAWDSYEEQLARSFVVIERPQAATPTPPEAEA